MAFIPTPHGARVVVNWVKGTETFSLVFYATKDGFDLAAQQALADAVDAVHTAVRLAGWAPQVSYHDTTVYDARESDGPIVTQNANTRAGTGSGEALPLNVAVCVTLRTPGRGRSSRGRKYVAGFGENSTTAGEWNSATLTNAVNYITAIDAAMTSVGWSNVIRSIQQDGQPVNPAATRAVTSMSIRSPKVATQRRRVDRP